MSSDITTTNNVSNISNFIDVSYITAKNTIDITNVSFNITFGKGKDSLVYTDEKTLKNFLRIIKLRLLKMIILNVIMLYATKGHL